MKLVLQMAVCRNSFSTVGHGRLRCESAGELVGLLPYSFSKVKVKFTLEHTTKEQMGSRVQLYSFFNLGAR